FQRTNVTDTFVGTAVGRPATSFKLKRSGLTGRVSRAASSNSFCIFAFLCNIANSSACFKSLASRSGFPPMPIPPLAASRRRVSFAIVNCIFEFRNVFAFSNNLLSAKNNKNVIKSIFTVKLKGLMRSAKQLVCDLFLSRNCKIKSFRQLTSSRVTPSDRPASFEVIRVGWGGGLASGGEGLAAVGAVARRVLCNQSCFGASENSLPRPSIDGITRAVSLLSVVARLLRPCVRHDGAYLRAWRIVPSSVDSFDLLLFLVVTMADDEVLFDDVYELCEIIGK
ncbi:hypothetical protein ALC62_10711, partial [Cyphomyrmex costatus]